MEAMMPSTTQSSSASGNTMDGLLPPSSSDTGASRSDAARMIDLPTPAGPVKPRLPSGGGSARGAPHSGPEQVSTLTALGGREVRHTLGLNTTAQGGRLV